MRERYDRTVGVELEGWLLNGSGMSVDVYDYLGGKAKQTDSGVLAWELCPSVVEASTRPCQSPGEILECLEEILKPLPDTWTAFWQPEDPTAWSARPRLDANHLSQRHKVMLEALRQIAGDHWIDVWHTVARFASTQVHVYVGDLPLDVRARVLGALNLRGPGISRRASERCERWPSKRLRECWQRFSEDQRMWRYDHAPQTWAELEEMYARVPRMLKNNGGQWEVDLETHGRLGDLDHEKHWWGGVRYRTAYDTVEFRMADSMPPEAALRLVDDVLDVAEGAIAGEFPSLTREEWLADLGR